MKTLSRVASGILILVGLVWMLQGFNILPGSFMTGQIEWAVYGGIAVAAGMALYFVTRRA